MRQPRTDSAVRPPPPQWSLLRIFPRELLRRIDIKTLGAQRAARMRACVCACVHACVHECVRAASATDATDTCGLQINSTTAPPPPPELPQLSQLLPLPPRGGRCFRRRRCWEPAALRWARLSPRGRCARAPAIITLTRAARHTPGTRAPLTAALIIMRCASCASSKLFLMTLFSVKFTSCEGVFAPSRAACAARAASPSRSARLAPYFTQTDAAPRVSRAAAAAGVIRPFARAYSGLPAPPAPRAQRFRAAARG
jgi:hypothetical protein